MGKITNLLIGLVVLAFIFTGFIFFMSNSSSKTGLVTFSDSSYTDTYNKIGEINNLTKDIQDTENKSVEQSTSDILGSYFKQGYSAFRLTLKSGSLATSMLDSSEQEMKIEDGTNMFFTMLATIIIIIVVFGVIIYVVVGKDV